MIKTDEISYWPKDHVNQIVTYDLQPITDVVDVYRSEFIMIQVDTPKDFKEVANDVEFNWKHIFGWGGFYPDTQVWSEDKKIIPYVPQPHTHYKIWMGGLYEYKGQLYGYTYWT
jgi:hypothetical protein